MIKTLLFISSRLIEDLKSEHTRQIGEMERRHNCDIKDLQERSKVEKQTWEENLLRRQEANALSKEREIRDQLRKERDKVRVRLWVD